MKILISGAGIGGLACAIFLKRSGFDVTVFEQHKQGHISGAGIQLAPNAMKIVRHIGLMPHLESRIFYPISLEMRNGISGKVIFQIPIKSIAENRYGAAYGHIYRRHLVEALLAVLGTDSIRFSCSISDFHCHHNGVRVMLANGGVAKGDILIAADGVHSLVRKKIFNADLLRLSKWAAWRCVVDMPKENPPPPAGCVWSGHKKHAVTTCIDGGALVNFVGITAYHWHEKRHWIKADKQAAIANFEGWHPTIHRILHSAKYIYRQPLFECAPLHSWWHDRVVLLGDACHPMVPFLAQGAAQALEDAVILTYALNTATSYQKAFESYFNIRRKRVTKIQRLSAKNGHLFHSNSKLSLYIKHLPLKAIARFAPHIVYRYYDWLWGYQCNHS